MSAQAVLTALVLPPLGLILAALALAVLAARGRRRAAALAAGALGLLLVLATPYVAGQLRHSLELPPPAVASPPGAIIVLGGDAVQDRGRLEIGPLTLERVRAGARLARAHGLPILVTGGPISPQLPTPLAEAMAESYRADFGLTVAWVETAARDTAENARLSAALLHAGGIEAAYLVTHAWHLPRALEAFARAGFVVIPAPVRLEDPPAGILSDWVPNPRAALESWYVLREWAGIVVYRLRDGGRQ
jgi:uncharacterized SAM-binding protein YcdF (DUF218 family)